MHILSSNSPTTGGSTAAKAPCLNPTEESSPSSAHSTSGCGLHSLEAIVLLFFCRPIANHLGMWKFYVYAVECFVLCFVCYCHLGIIISWVTGVAYQVCLLVKNERYKKA